MDGKLLDRYAGRYSILPEATLTVRREGDHLSVQEVDEPKEDLLPESETDFFSTVADDTYSLEINSEIHFARLMQPPATKAVIHFARLTARLKSRALSKQMQRTLSAPSKAVPFPVFSIKLFPNIIAGKNSSRNISGK